MISWKRNPSLHFIVRKKEGTKLSSYKQYLPVRYTTTVSSQRLSRKYFSTQQNRFSSTEVRYLQKHILILRFTQRGSRGDILKNINRILFQTLVSTILLLYFSNVTKGDELRRDIQSFIDRPEMHKFDSAMKQCTLLKDLHLAKQFHRAAVNSKLTFETKHWNNLITMYSKCNDGLQCALQVFQDMQKNGHQPNVYSYTALIAAYGNSGYPDDSRRVFQMMQKNGITPDVVAWNALIAAYRHNTQEVENIFNEMQQSGVNPTVATWNTLIDIYGQNGMVDEALKLFHEMQQNGAHPNIITWTTLVSVCGQSGRSTEALQLFEEMQRNGIKPNVVSWTAVIDAYGHSGDVQNALKVFEEMQRFGIKPNIVTWTALINAYGNSGNVNEAQRTFDDMQRFGIKPNLVSWNALITAYGQNGRPNEAHELFHEMQRNGIKATSSVWNSLIDVYANHGNGTMALELFEEMQRNGVTPDVSTFTCVLNACSHCGLVDEALKLYNRLNTDFGITPSILHQNCIVDALSRCGRLKEAEEFIMKMERVDVTTWRSFIGGCRVHGDVERAERAAERALQLAPMDASIYVLLCNTYASTQQFEKEALIRELMQIKRVNKIPGQSWIYINGSTHTFVASQFE